MEDNKDYKLVFDNIVEDLRQYVLKYNLKSMVLGISGGIDSTVCAAICHEVSKKTGIPLIGRSLTIKNKTEETSIAKIVGESFCNDFAEVNLKDMYNGVSENIMFTEHDKYGSDWTNPIADGNIQARLRMIYLYHLAGINRGIVIDTDNVTENRLGFYTIHGDQGDYKPIGNLWKTEVYKLAGYLLEKYKYNADMKFIGVTRSIAIAPTDGLGISSSDLEQIGAESYAQVDYILQELEAIKKFDNVDDEGAVDILYDDINDLLNVDQDVKHNVADRFKKSAFKRRSIPVANIG